MTATSVKPVTKPPGKQAAKAQVGKKKKRSAPKKFTLDCSRPQEDGIFNAGDFVSITSIIYIWYLFISTSNVFCILSNEGKIPA